MIVDPDLTKAIYEKSWEGKWFGEDGVLAIYDHLLQASRHLEVRERSNILSGYASSYHGAAGNALARLRRHPWKFWWGFIALSCAFEALRASDALEGQLGGITHMSADQLDVRQSILRRFPWRRRDAILCMEEVLFKWKDAPHHTRALVAVGYAELASRQPYNAVARADCEHWLDEALTLVQLFEGEEPRQASRVYRTATRIYRRTGEPLKAHKCSKRAEKLARSVGAKDQLLKGGATAS